VRLAITLILVYSSFAFASSSHLERLRLTYPYGLIGDDYGLLTWRDLAINTCFTEMEPHSEEENGNISYSYWQCFPTQSARMVCSDYAYMSLEIQTKEGKQSYLARGPMSQNKCRSLQSSWREKIKGQKYFCVSGSYNGNEIGQDGKIERNWVFDRFKSRAGCEAYRSYCELNEIKGGSCVLPKGPSLRF